MLNNNDGANNSGGQSGTVESGRAPFNWRQTKKFIGEIWRGILLLTVAMAVGGSLSAVVWLAAYLAAGGELFGRTAHWLICC